MDLKTWNEAVTPHRMIGLLGNARIPYTQMLAFSINCCRLIEGDLGVLQAQLLDEVDRTRAVDDSMKRKAEALRLENSKLNKPGISKEEDKRFWMNNAIYSLFQDRQSYANKAPIHAGDADLLRTYEHVGSFIARKYVQDPYEDPPPEQLFEANEVMASMLRELVPNPLGA